MSIQLLRAALEDAGAPRNASLQLVRALLGTITEELEKNSYFVLRGIGRIEVVANVRKNFRAVSGTGAQLRPVRVRLEASRELKKQIGAAYAKAPGGARRAA